MMLSNEGRSVLPVCKQQPGRTVQCSSLHRGS